MKDQPKPATGELWIGGNCKFCNEPDGKHKPDCRRTATGEWTVERLREYLGGYSSYDLQLRAMSKLINAALAKAVQP